MSITSKDIVGELVAKDYRMATVFKTAGIDFCCRGNRSIEEVCEKNNLDSAELIKKLESVQVKNDGAIDFDSWSIDLLADYIEKKHHRYVEEKIKEIKPFLNKVVRVHGAQHPELVEIEEQFLASAGELTLHMKKEELIIFPFVQKLMKHKASGDKMEPAHFGTIENPISMMKEEHDIEGVRFRRISELSSDYNPPAEACTTYRVTYAMLKEFEDDLHTHIHLENNILFPKAIELEKMLAN
ncbi:MAG: iron-sulfur cluster repair di-iron protein [Flavobacteriales bacterium]|nr:iron-sulfur cluster repair di-iron protein [Flavobacteriales bacterium]